MDLEIDPRGQALRDEVRDFLATNLTPELRKAGERSTSMIPNVPYSLQWQRILHLKGWAAPTWPIEYGGTGWNVIERYIFASECARAKAPILSPNGIRMVGPCIMAYGTEQQKSLHLPRILSGDDFWCQGYSEPGAGSDLASLQMRADSDGNDYILNGSKIWTTDAQYANRMFCLVRTRREGKPQQGITFLLLDMASPGILVQPIITLAGDHDVNQVFFDNVRVPKANRLGLENDGWSVAKYLLEFERGKVWAPALKIALQDLRAVASGTADGYGSPLLEDSAFRTRLSEIEIAVEAIEISEHRLMADLVAGKNPGPNSSILKIQATEALQTLDELSLEIAAYFGGIDQLQARQPDSNMPFLGPEECLTFMSRYLNNRAATIYGGTNEIQRDILARTLLGL